MKKLSIKKSIKAFIEGWVEELADPFTSWLYQSVLHWNVIMLIADGTFNEYDISFEDICKKINHRIGSRSSIQYVLGNSLSAGYVQKKLCHNDKRAKYYNLTKSAMEEFELLLVLDADSYEYKK